MKKVISVKPAEDKKVAVVFSDGLSGVFDVAPYRELELNRAKYPVDKAKGIATKYTELK